MPRFYFDVDDGRMIVEDDEGSDLPDLPAAEAEARQALGDLARDILRVSTPAPILSINIRDHLGKQLLSVSLTYSVAPAPA